MTPIFQTLPLARQTLLEAPLIQLCFTVSDLDSAVRDFARTTYAGPWYRIAPLSPEKDQTTHRGYRSALGADIALAYSGNMMYELVAPRHGSISVFSEWVARFGYGLHHFGYASEAFDADTDDMMSAGKNPVMTSVTARGARVAMFEAGGFSDTLLEIIEITRESQRFYHSLRMAATNWADKSSLYTDLTCYS